jgi:S1-C subfamily serine protease
MSLLTVLISVSTLVLTQDGGGSRATVQDLVDFIGPRTVALQIERPTSEEPEVFGQAFLERLENLGPVERENLKSYFRRPDGPVTGFLIDDDGHILTSNYNVDGELTRIDAILASGTKVPATLVARDRVSDLALLKIDPKNLNGLELPDFEWARSEDYQAGHLVISLGRSPAPLSPTVTIGIISAPARQFGRIFQTDAALNYGNVGGPLLSLDGRVLGMAAFVGHDFPLWGLNSGVGFGVRANTVLDVLPHLKSGRSFERSAFLGVYADRGRQNGISGAPVEKTEEGFPAAKGGMKARDVIIEFDGVSVRDFPHLQELIFFKRPGDRVSVKVRRSDASVDLEITLGSRPKGV